MQSTSVYLIEFYALLLIMNAFLGVVTGLWQEDNPDSSLRSPFGGYPLGSDFAGLDTNTTTNEIIGPTTTTDGPLSWFNEGVENFQASITAILTFVSFFTAGFILQLFETMGIPEFFWILVTAPMGLYLMYMTFVMITNRLGN